MSRVCPKRVASRWIGAAVCCVVVAAAATAYPQDWPQWRGVHRDGKVAGFTAPETWPKAPEAAEALKITAPALLKLKIIDEIVPEPPGGAHRNVEDVMKAVRKALLKHLAALKSLSIKKLLDRRYEKFSKIGRN